MPSVPGKSAEGKSKSNQIKAKNICDACARPRCGRRSDTSPRPNGFPSPPRVRCPVLWNRSAISWSPTEAERVTDPLARGRTFFDNLIGCGVKAISRYKVKSLQRERAYVPPTASRRNSRLAACATPAARSALFRLGPPGAGYFFIFFQMGWKKSVAALWPRIGDLPRVGAVEGVRSGPKDQRDQRDQRLCPLATIQPVPALVDSTDYGTGRYFIGSGGENVEDGGGRAT